VPTEKPTFATIPFPSLLGGGSVAPAPAPAAPAKAPRPYSVRDAYAVDDVIDHQVLGVGRVTSVDPGNRISVAFPDETRVLVHQIGAVLDAPVLDVGEEVEAYCPSPRCKADKTHTIISMYEDEIRRVQCVSCGEVHAYRVPRGEKAAAAVPAEDETDESSFAELNESANGNENLSRSVDELELSVRTANSLREAGITYIGELVQKTEHDMLTTKNFGRKNLVELNEILAEMGLRLGMDVGDWSAP
jgi:hypothetical protein